MNEAYQYMLEKDRISNDKMLKVMNEKLAAEYDISILCSNRDISNKPIYRMKPTRILVDTTALCIHRRGKHRRRIVMVKSRLPTTTASWRITYRQQESRLSPDGHPTGKATTR